MGGQRGLGGYWPLVPLHWVPLVSPPFLSPTTFPLPYPLPPGDPTLQSVSMSFCWFFLFVHLLLPVSTPHRQEIMWFLAFLPELRGSV